MKFRIHQIFLSLFFALGFCFSFSIEASAHDYPRSDGQHTYTHSEDINISAADVDRADQAQMKKFVLHLATHLDLIEKDTSLDETRKRERSRESTIFARETRQTGPFNNGSDIYAIGVTSRGTITNHGVHQNLLGYKYDSSENPLQTLLGDTVPELSDNVDPACATYDSGNRVACAVRVQALTGTPTIIAGFHHAADDPVVIAPECDDFTLAVTAKQLEDETDSDTKEELLKQYVKGVIKITTKIFVDTANEVEPTDLITETVARFLDKVACFREPNLRYGSIYAFVMDPIGGFAFINGNDFTLNGLSVSLNDPDPPSYDGKGNIEPNVLTAIHRTLTGTPPPDPPDLSKIKHGDSGFFTYHWAHPVNTELNTPDYLDRNEVPGRALKESYIEVADVYADIPAIPIPVLFVFGSGIYLEEEMMAEDDDDGCSIAAAGNTPQSMLLNLFLIASILFSTVFLRRRV